MKKIFYNAYTQKDNVGDILINKYLIEEYAKYATVYVDCQGMPEEFVNSIFKSGNKNIISFSTIYNHSIRSVYTYRVISFLHNSGFSLFTCNAGPFAIIEGSFWVVMKRIVKLLGFLYAKRQGIRTAVVGIDLDISHTSGILKVLNRNLVKNIDDVYVRSKRNVQENISFCKLSYIPDMAFLCPEITNTSKEYTRKKKIAISFREVDNLDKLLSFLKDVVLMGKREGYDIDLVYQVNRDKLFCEVIAGKLAGDVNFVQEIITCDNLRKYREYDIVISNRLHVLLLSSAYGAIPFAAISNSEKENKIKRIFESVFEDDLCHFLDDESVQRKFNSVLLKLHEIKESVRKNFVSQQVLCKEKICELMSKLD